MNKRPMNRLPPSPTQRIDRGEKLTFTFEGQSMTGYQGDSVATAMYAGGVRIFSRSIKYHRPRGLYSLDGESSNCLVNVDGLPNCRAETTPLREGMVVTPQNVARTPDWDKWGVMDKLDWAMPAGFYYRVFHKPYDLWPFFMRRIRMASGIGRLGSEWTPGRYEELHLNAEVCVIGGGPAGLLAATEAADRGLRVVLFEARPRLGGIYDWRVREGPDGIPLYQRAAEMATQTAGRANLRTLTHTFVTGLWGDNLVTAFQVGTEDQSFDEQYIEVRAESVVVATGSTERPLIFKHNERPGVMQASCAHRLAATHGLLPGKRAVFSVGSDIGLESAADLADWGLEISAVADCRVDGHDPVLVEALSERGIPFLPGWSASRAEGDRTVTGVVLTSLDRVNRRRYNCDLLAASAGLTPNNGLLSMVASRMIYDRRTNFYLPDPLPPKVHAAGRLWGYADPRSIEASGRAAGVAAAMDCGAADEQELAAAEEELAACPEPAKGSIIAIAAEIGQGRKSFICFDEDATVKHIAQACQQGFDVPELAKRFTATGTGPGQGGVPGHNLPMLISLFRGESLEDFAPTTNRPPMVPMLMATLAGPKRDVFKRTPLYRAQQEAGGIFRRVGEWKRARYFSDDFSSQDELRAVREGVGLIDVSTLGKFRLFGPDALLALERLYICDMSRIRSDRVSYVAMCNDDGCLIDDGVIVKRADNDYYFTTSTGRAGSTVEWFRFHTRFDHWDYHLVNLTDAYAALNLAGPESRKVLQKLTDTDLSNKAFPYLGFREMTLAGRIPARVMRLGFVGELSYELHVPSSWALSLWERLIEAGEEYGLLPFGLEAQNVLRLEKGHVIIGQDTEIRTTLHDLGLGFLWHRDKTEAKTVGAAALGFTEHQPGRLKLVGFELDDSEPAPGDGAIVVDDNTVLGHVTTARFSQALGKSIGLALVNDRLSAKGVKLEIFQAGLGLDRLTARVVGRPFYDPEGKRLRM